MVREIIDTIREAEAKAASIMDEARRKRAELVAGARDDARKSVDRAHKRGADIHRQVLADAQKQVERRVAEIAKSEAEKREALKRAASDRMSRAVQAITTRMVK